jgi:hypothetical protein
MRKFPASAIGTLCLIGVALAVEPPLQKEGLWSIHRQTINNPGNVTHESSEKICRNHAYDQDARSRAKNRPGCKVLSESFSGRTYAIEMQCTVAHNVIKSKGTTTFQGDTAFRSETHATYWPALYGVSETWIMMEQKYLGSCPEGTQPGDLIHPDGTVTHLGKH